eukprot:TRINITY_DN359_c0_g1_i1.p1 TRINITY_DN359_c0_g1~~TRINITY_DN359_c0_g1_i1.p1  ORF type:complete len:255 (-),score=73.15 TRINITY_DN359_c0_g1_i1:197-886(-)
MAARILAITLVAYAALVSAEDAAMEAALAADDLCLANGGEDCSMELRQLRGEVQEHQASELSQQEQQELEDREEAQAEAEEATAAETDVTDEASDEAEAQMSQEEQDAFEETLKLDAEDLEDETYRGRCRNGHDMKIWKNGGHRLFDKALAKFGRQCVAGVPCTKGLLHKKAGYTWKCAGCMAGLVACSASPKCIGVCIAGQTPACNHCVKHKCRPRFKRCSGLNAGGH